MFPGDLHQPVLLGAVAGDGEGGAGVAAPDARQCGDRVVHALFVLQSAEEQQFGWPVMPCAAAQKANGWR